GRCGAGFARTTSTQCVSPKDNLRMGYKGYIGENLLIRHNYLCYLTSSKLLQKLWQTNWRSL
ncbi:MAG: hypothetical protein ACK46E_12435, partial [Pseudanabaena sp.]